MEAPLNLSRPLPHLPNTGPWTSLLMVTAPGSPVSLKSLVYPATGSSISVWQGVCRREVSLTHSQPKAGHRQSEDPALARPGPGPLVAVTEGWCALATVFHASGSCVTEHLPLNSLVHIWISGVSKQVSHFPEVSQAVHGEAGLESRQLDLKAPPDLQAVLTLYHLGQRQLREKMLRE